MKSNFFNRRDAGGAGDGALGARRIWGKQQPNGHTPGS